MKPPIQDGVWDPFFGGDKWPDSTPGDEVRYRRSIYTYTKRSIPYPMFESFDSPSREFCSPRRLRSNTPLQALEMLNSEAMHECAKALAERMRSAGDSPAQQIEQGYLLTVAREPTEKELAVLTGLTGQSEDTDGLEDVATVLLSRDEFLTK